MATMKYERTYVGGPVTVEISGPDENDEVDIEILRRHADDGYGHVPFGKLAEFVDAVRAERAVAGKVHTPFSDCRCTGKGWPVCDACRAAGCGEDHLADPCRVTGAKLRIPSDFDVTRHVSSPGCRCIGCQPVHPAPDVRQPPPCPVCGSLANPFCTEQHVPWFAAEVTKREINNAYERRVVDRYRAWANEVSR